MYFLLQVSQNVNRILAEIVVYLQQCISSITEQFLQESNGKGFPLIV